VYTWLGFCRVEVLESPKSQLHDVGLPVDRSANATGSGACPLSGVPAKSTTGAGGGGGGGGGVGADSGGGAVVGCANRNVCPGPVLKGLLMFDPRF